MWTSVWKYGDKEKIPNWQKWSTMGRKGVVVVGGGDDREEDSVYVQEAVYCGRNRLYEM
jgi:hypothetical protein